VDASDGRWSFGSQSSPTCVVMVGHGGCQRQATESWRLVAVSASGGLAFVSWWSYSSHPNPARSEGSSGGVHRLRVAVLPL
jgi:hypothetical protein